MKKAFPFIAAFVVLGAIALVVWLAISEKISFGNKEPTALVETVPISTTAEESTTAASPVFEPLTDENGEPVTDENGATTLVEVSTTAPATTAKPTTTRRSFSASDEFGTSVPSSNTRTTSKQQSQKPTTTVDERAFQKNYSHQFISDDALESQYKANKAPFDSFYGRSVTMAEYLKWANSLVSSTKAQTKTGSDGSTYYYHSPMKDIVEFAVVAPDGYIRAYMLFTSSADAQDVWNNIT